jgi:hypothetical protein
VVGSFCRDGILEHVESADHKVCHSDFYPLYRSITAEIRQRVSSIVFSLSRMGR